VLETYPVETDLASALAHQPDGVIVSNPTALHLDVAIPAALAGCHILLEKPVSYDLTRIDELKAAAAASGSRILMGFQFRHHPALQAIKTLLEDGAIGRPVSVRAHYGDYLPDWHPWEDYRQSYAARKDLGGGVILTLTHPLDYLRWLFGDVHALSAEAGTYGDLGIEVEDTAEIVIHFDNGVLASVHLDYLQRPPRHDLHIIGIDGTIRWDHLATSFALWTAERVKWQHIPIAPNFDRDTQFDRDTLFAAQMRHFIEVVRGSQPPRCTLDDGIWAQRLALAALRSAAEGQRIDITIEN
jgi:predicted dehydrogenase